MKTNGVLALLFTILLLPIAVEAQLPNKSQIAAGDSAITDARLRAHIKFLADDLLEGRGPGTRGDDLAMAYITAQFRALGLKPAARKSSLLAVAILRLKKHSIWQTLHPKL